MFHRLSCVEYELLDLVEEQPNVLALLSGGDAGADPNKGFRHFDTEDLVEALERLAREQWIEYTRGRLGPGEGEDIVSMTREELLRELNRAGIRQSPHRQPTDASQDEPLVGYRLTPAGGAIWEEFASPAWDWYVDVWFKGEEKESVQSVELTACSREVVETEMRTQVRYFGWEIDEASISWSELAPWEVRYWKSLPSAYRATFSRRDKLPEERKEIVNQYTFLLWPERWRRNRLSGGRFDWRRAKGDTRVS